MKLSTTTRTLICAWACATAALAQAAPSGIYERATEEGSVELSNLSTEEDAQLVVEGTPTDAQATTPNAAAEDRTAARARTVAADSASEAAAVADGSVAAQGNGTERSGSGSSAFGGSAGGTTAFNGNMGVSPMTSLGAGNEGAASAMPVGTQTAGQGGVASQGGAAGTGPTTVRPSILDNPTALEARAQQYRDLMLHAPLEADGKPANPAIVRRYLMTTRSAFQGGR